LRARLLVGKDLRNIVAVDQDPLSLGVVASQHDGRVSLVEANAITYLRQAARDGERFDLIYTLGLTDYFDERAMRLLHKLMRQCLAPGGRIMVANFLPGHLSTAWMDAVMDWHLVYRTEAQMGFYADGIGMRPHLFRDASNSIVFCEMSD
jgi:extracellular factor (EF) 3-hydroxypalmitic acid methyl ester biosynthesis protein